MFKLLKDVQNDFYIKVDNETLENIGFLHCIFSYITAILLFFIATIVFPFLLILHIFKFIYNIYKLLVFKRINVGKILKSFEKKIDKMNSLYLIGYRHFNRSESDFIKLFIIQLKDEHVTYDSKTQNLICSRGCRRSLGDIYRITKYYYPDTTLKSVLSTLIRLLENKQIAGSYCNETELFVFHRNSGYINYDHNVEYSDNIKFKDVVNYYKKNKYV